MVGTRRRRAAFTLLELLVCCAVVGILAALVLPAVQAARESARRSACLSNLRQIGVALSVHLSGRPTYPPANYERSPLAALLPYLDRSDLYDSMNFAPTMAGDCNRTSTAKQVGVFICPSDPNAAVLDHGESAASYAGNEGTGRTWHRFDGVFQPEHVDLSKLRPADVADGLSKTVAFSEQTVGGPQRSPTSDVWNLWDSYPFASDEMRFVSACKGVPEGAIGVNQFFTRGRDWWHSLPGLSLYNHVLTPNNPSCTAPEGYGFTSASFHSGLVFSLYCDGHASPTSDQIDLAVWRALGTRNGAEPVAP